MPAIRAPGCSISNDMKVWGFLCATSVILMSSVVRSTAYTSPMNPLSSARRSELRAEAHKLSPVVIIGDKKGLTDEVLAEVERSLKAHELIKVRAATDDRDARNVWMESICEKLGAHPVQQIGKVFVIYRENPKETPAPATRGPRPAVRSPRPVGRTRGGEAPRPKPVEKRKAQPKTGLRRPRTPRAEPEAEPRTTTRTGRPLSRTPSPRPESEPRRRRPRTSR
jgi:RNA-binding protein